MLYRLSNFVPFVRIFLTILEMMCSISDYVSLCKRKDRLYADLHFSRGWRRVVKGASIGRPHRLTGVDGLINAAPPGA